MTADQFVWWLRGFLSLAAANHPLSVADVETVRAQLDKIGAPAPYAPPAPAPANFGKLVPFCPKCGTNLSGLSLGAVAHNC